MKEPVTVRTTMRPDEEMKVREEEATDLRRSGLVLAEEPPSDVDPETVKLGPARRRVENREPNE